MSFKPDVEKARSGPVKMSGIVDNILGTLGLRRNYHGWLVVSQWPRLVGEHYARKSHAFRFDDGVLFVACEDPIWRQEMAMDTEEILKIIHAEPYGRVVKSLRLVRGEKGIRSNAD